MKSTQPPYLLHARPQIEVIGISQKNLYSEFLENVLRDTFDRCQRAYRHEDRRFDLSVRRDQAPRAGRAGFSFNMKMDRHS